MDFTRIIIQAFPLSPNERTLFESYEMLTIHEEQTILILLFIILEERTLYKLLFLEQRTLLELSNYSLIHH